MTIIGFVRILGAVLVVLFSFPLVLTIQHRNGRLCKFYSKAGINIFMILILAFFALCYCSIAKVLSQNTVNWLGLLLWFGYVIDYAFLDCYFFERENNNRWR